MSEVIHGEILLFLISASTGVLILFVYDLLRVLRRVFPRGAVLVGIEDLLYWCAAGILIFYMIFMKNSGSLRGFSLAAVLLGMLLYNQSISKYLVKGLSTALTTIFRLFKRVFHVIFLPFSFLFKKTREILPKTLKNWTKRFKMALRRH